MLRVSDTADDENRKTCWPIPVAGPMRHDGEVCSAQFSADGQRVVTASGDKTARVWDAPVIRNQDAPDDVLLLADLAEAACGSVLQTSGQTEILKLLPPDQVRATREKIAAKFERQSSGLAPVERLLKLKWSVSELRRRTISPFSKVTVPEWIENRIKQGTFESLRAAIQMDPAKSRLIAHFGVALANLAVTEKTDPDDNAQRADSICKIHELGQCLTVRFITDVPGHDQTGLARLVPGRPLPFSPARD